LAEAVRRGLRPPLSPWVLSLKLSAKRFAQEPVIAVNIASVIKIIWWGDDKLIIYSL
jgi:hypothetical protein